MPRRVLAIAFVSACGGGGANQPAQPEPAPAPACTAVADAMVTQMLEGRERQGIEDTVDGFTALIRVRCEEDRWTAEARQCLATMRTRADAERCSTLLTDEQQANLVRDQKETFGDRRR